MNKAILLDRDGTINFDSGYVYKKEDFHFIDGVIDGLKLLSDMGYIIIIITNQSGIGRGYYTEKDFLLLNEFLMDVFKKNNINLKKIYYCPHIDADNCDCRKPKLKLFYDAIKEFQIDLNKSYVIGDRDRDLSLCEHEIIKGILITNEFNSKYICKRNLLEAAKYIEETENI